ncbi:hypothetical protein THMIRHAS_01150 [Thiosulfatimonas sediminis]|uniref:Uncharacterized protein n=1 Tax=Thiosulfatimonas sediminis TaxID=2675054 RepID=A0A6F8PRI5_9GAMM|nr:hypothetical protein [Thiosulfatimonas sediminis]BBP44742.1 hypothetical protein THMIRHAS_01150 [Thiosulfatimonas sediminis]
MQDSEHTYRFGRGSDAEHRHDQALFKQLLEQHTLLQRQTFRLPNGIKAQTTAATPELVEILQQHVVGMEKRFAKGRAIRSWDPLFAALFEYKDQMQMEYRMLDNGIEAILTSDDPKLIELIHCHDLTLHGFVEQGFTASKNPSPKPDWLT